MSEFTETIDSIEETWDSARKGVYANAEAADAEGIGMRTQRGDTADEVDPRALVRDPTLSEIRWYYRRTFASVLVDKPIDDAFKNGFEIEHAGDSGENPRRLLREPRWDGPGEGFIGAYRFAEKKARRDGFALIFLGTREKGSSGIHESPIDEDVDVAEVSHLKVLTIDDLGNGVPHDQIEEGTGLDHSDYKVRETGIVVNTDVNSPDYRTPVGYVLSGPEPKFIHADRVMHLTWRPEVDGDYKENGVRRWNDRTDTLGVYEGDSVLIPSYDILKGIAKGNWATMQALFRNASHMYTVTLPPDADKEDLEIANAETRNINAKSSMVLPPEYDVQQHESGGEMEVDRHFEVLFDQICATHEMTKSVLFGTQAGTVSGSEVDIKNYFNKVERYRTNRAEEKIEQYLTRVKRMTDTRTSRTFRYEVDIEWNPLFKVDDETRLQMLQNASQSISTLIGSYAMTPDEARSLLTSQFVDIDLDELTEQQMDFLDRINLTRSGQGPSALQAEKEMEGEGSGATAQAAQAGAESGQQQGQTQSSEQPQAADSAVERLERLAELHEAGHISDSEFEALKEDIIENG